jgi:hypothetical protein
MKCKPNAPLCRGQGGELRVSPGNTLRGFAVKIPQQPMPGMRRSAIRDRRVAGNLDAARAHLDRLKGSSLI